jgi:CBS domain-containing protein
MPLGRTSGRLYRLSIGWGRPSHEEAEMTRRKVRDLMTTGVVTVTEDVPFKELAEIMAERGVSALPVLDHQGRVTGVVSETDLLRKEEYQEDPDMLPRG